MNAIGLIDPAVADDGWDTLICDINQWRGDAINAYAQVEAAASETLLIMAALPGRGTDVELPHLFGRRLESLRSAVAPPGPFAREGARAARALDAFSGHQARRAIICHGIAKIARDRHGRWIFIFSLLALRNGKEERSFDVFDLQEADAMLASLKSNTKELRSALQSLRDQLKARPSLA